MARHSIIPLGFRRAAKKSDFTLKKYQTTAAMILASGMSAFAQDATPAPSLSKLEELATPKFALRLDFSKVARQRPVSGSTPALGRSVPRLAGRLGKNAAVGR